MTEKITKKGGNKAVGLSTSIFQVNINSKGFLLQVYKKEGHEYTCIIHFTFLRDGVNKHEKVMRKTLES